MRCLRFRFLVSCWVPGSRRTIPMRRMKFSPRLATSILCGVCWSALGLAMAADRFDAAVAHSGRSAADLKRDPLDHPAELLRLTGIKPGMRVADVLAGDGYYSELLSYVVGPS